MFCLLKGVVALMIASCIVLAAGAVSKQKNIRPEIWSIGWSKEVGGVVPLISEERGRAADLRRLGEYRCRSAASWQPTGDSREYYKFVTIRL